MLTIGQARSNHLLVPTGPTGYSPPSVKDRRMHQRLVGADVYVARLAKTSPRDENTNKSGTAMSKEGQLGIVINNGNPARAESEPSRSIRSLHDELVCKPKEAPLSKIATNNSEDHRSVAESRPCYRCVAYMHSVGIKRVFWTTNNGKWDGAKIRDLIDDLEGAMDRADPSLGLPVPDVFVTKHEVLLLRRLMMSGRKS